MTPEIVTDFLTGYIRSLSEESRQEKKGPRHGFDHIIYELAIAQGLIPFRLSFYRQGEAQLASPKKEAEHGVDQAFIARDGKTLWIFVLKDEILNYRNWTDENFDTDLRRARDQDLTSPEFALIEKVLIVLAYNKDENEEGLESYEKLVRSSGSKMGDHATLIFERWNLTTITEKVREHLLTPSLLPESFFKRFTYLCWQVGDFTHGSPQWNDVLIPDWREFLASVLTDPVSERSIHLISVAMIILRSYGKRNADGKFTPSFETGWLDLVEWAVLALWDAANKTEDKAITCAILDIWFKFYLTELEMFYADSIEFLKFEHSLESGGGVLNEGASTYRAFWHMGRLGLLAMAISELQFVDDKESRANIDDLSIRISNWIIELLNANPSCQRPLLDINHIEIFLVWRALAICGRWDDILAWFHSLFQRLLFRRLGKGGCRLIDYSNSWESIFEYLATGEKPHSGFGKSSYLLLMLIEICFGTPNGKGDELATVIHSQLILGKNGNDLGKFPFKEQVELMGWAPPSDWSKRILSKPVHEGICLPVHFSAGEGELEFLTALRKFIENTRKEFSLELPTKIPFSVFVLGCIKHISPLPNEFWRICLFGLCQPK